MKHRYLLVAIAVVAACSSGEAATTTTTATSLPPTTTTTASVTTTSTAIATGGAEECVLGDWSLDTHSFAEAMSTVMSATGAEAAVMVTAGGGSLSFAEGGQATGGYEELTIEVQLVEDLPEMEIVLSGEVVGTWEVEGDTLIFSPDETSSFEVEASVGGQSMPVPLDPSLMNFGSSRSTITCEGDELTIEPEVEGAAPTVWLRA